MTLKLLGFSAFALAVMGTAASQGFIPGHAAYSKPACMASMKKQASELVSQIDANAFCACMADMKLTRETATFEKVKPCLDRNLKDPIVNTCEKDEKEKYEAQHTVLPEGETLSDDTHLYTPLMNCECVYDHAADWIWRNFDAAMKNEKLKPDEAGKFANATMNECRWK